jgi:hypothetical protein
MSVYGLNDILRGVARIDPESDAKINSMRKSYEGQVKSFELAGLNKPIKKDLKPPFNPGRLMSTYRIPPQTEGFDIDAYLEETLPLAMQFQPGKLGKKQEEWNRLLGNEKPKVIPLPATQLVQPTAAVQPNGRQPVRRPQQELHRPRRVGKRRRYDDDSYEGYADGYVDEDQSESEGDRGSARKRQRKQDSDEY